MLGSSVGNYSLPFVLETGAKYIAAGCTNTIVVKTGGGVTIRGESQYFPDNVSAITGVKKADIDWCHFLLLKEDGTVMSWGYYEDDMLTQRNMTPFIYEGASDIVDVYAGAPNCVLRKADNTCYSVTNPYYSDYSYISNAVTPLTSQIQTADGYLEQMFRVAPDGSVTACGYNTYHQLGIEESVAGSFIPNMTPVPHLSEVVQISTSQEHAIALCEDGSIWTWGRNHMGQLGRGNTSERELPAKIAWGDPSRDGSTYEKAYVLTENSAAAPTDYSRDNWFVFTPTESGSYLIEGFGSFCPWGSFPDAYFYTTATPDLNNYSMRWDTNYSPNPWEGPIRYDYNSHFYFEPTLTAGQTYYIRVEEAPENTGYGVRVTKQERIMDLTGTTMVEMEAEDMTLYDWDRDNVHAVYGIIEYPGASGGKALSAHIAAVNNGNIEDASDVYMPPLTFAMKSPYQQNYYFWVRTRVNSASEDSLWFNGGYMDGYVYNNMGLNIGTVEEPWTWTMVGTRQLINGIHSIGICPREFGGLIDKILITTDPDYVPTDPPQSEYQVFEMEDGTNTAYEAEGSSAAFTVGADSFASGYQSATANVASGSGNIDEVNADAAPALSFSVPIDSEDVYSVWVRARNISDSSDSVWFAADEETYAYTDITHAAENEWKWTRLRYGTWTEGTHTLKLIPREAGGIYDKIVVRRGNEEPSDAMVNGHAVFEMEDTLRTSPFTETATI